MEKESTQNVQKIYISDSPVHEDVEYSYVNSDVEEDLQKSLHNDRLNPNNLMSKGTDSDLHLKMSSAYNTNEDDELAREGEYQNALQERFKVLTREEKGENKSILHSKNPGVDESTRQHLKQNSTDENDTGEEEEDDYRLMNWKNPPINPFSNPNINTVESPDVSRYENLNESSGEQLNQASTLKGQSKDFLNSRPPRKNGHNYSSPKADDLKASLSEGLLKSRTPPDNQVNIDEEVRNQFIYSHTSPYELQNLVYGASTAQYQLHAHQLKNSQQSNIHLQDHEMEFRLQRKATVMYMPNAAYQNEYEIRSPRVPKRHSEKSENITESPTDHSGRQQSEGRGSRMVVAPKPVKPPKNFLQKNMERAVGHGSAKPGYNDRHIQKKLEEEQLKHWAPGMILPRKKAASADDVMQYTGDDSNDAEDLWNQKSKALAISKQLQKGGKKNKSVSRGTTLQRNPSENSIKQASKIPPINTDRDKRTYLSNYQENLRNGPDTNFNPHQQSLIASPLRHSPHVVLPLPNNIVTYPPQAMPQYAINVNAYQHYPQPYAHPPALYMIPGQHGPPSGGYHHQPRYLQNDQRQFYPLENVVNPWQEQRNLPVNFPYLHQPADHQLDYHNYKALEEYTTYEYKDSQRNEKIALVSEFDGKSYGESSTSSPIPTQVMNMKRYVSIPPIGVKHTTNTLEGQGSYAQAYQKEKEKVEKLSRPPQYKVYTLNDYKNLRLEYKLGGLGPSQDPAVIKEKNEIRIKQLQYAKTAMDAEKNKPHTTPREKAKEDVKQINGRVLAIEYSKHIPKPNAPVKQRDSPELLKNKTAALHPLNNTEIRHSQPQDNSELLADLENLQKRHEEEMKSVAKIHYKRQQATI